MTKEDILKIIINKLEQTPRTQLNSLRSAVKEELRSRGLYGEVTRQQGNLRITENLRVDTQTALLTNEVIYDLLYGRVITPGMDEHNLDLPWIHVSSLEKLAQLKEQLR
ncbi:hypothetical protein [Bacillus thuringiensis]|uniref:hypothetical protein n=1 Tax=Bacillus thuringiensis TaxID=1428 RepID=UPI000BF9EC21|nr:hypothetical protein [Bacillus thuringiensis]PFS02960.1 hypothetical protein COK60_20535 [Bacillus thuringiensis]